MSVEGTGSEADRRAEGLEKTSGPAGWNESHVAFDRRKPCFC